MAKLLTERSASTSPDHLKTGIKEEVEHMAEQSIRQASTDQTFILPFSSPQADLAHAGGKGANLAELSRAGFRVPDGFLVTTTAYQEFVQQNGLQAQILDLAAGAGNDPQALEECSAKIRQLFEQGNIPGQVRANIVAAYGRWGTGNGAPLSAGPPVAVRSSATAEDLPGLSFAGQQESYLNVIGAEAVVAATQRCWSSLWTARAIGYRARNGIPSEEIALAVVVQQMVPAPSAGEPAQVSGVLFTANPLTGRRDEVTIDATFGLGEALVSGQVEPDYYVVDSETGRITQRRIGAKGMAIVARLGGGITEIKPQHSQEQALPDQQILELVQVAKQIAAHFGSPQDVEWAWAEGKLYILQARPMTTLYPWPMAAKKAQGLRLYFSFNGVQGLTDPITPIGQDALYTIFGGVNHFLGAQRPAREIFFLAGERIYMDLTDAAVDPRFRKLLLAFLRRADPSVQQLVIRLIKEGRLAQQTASRDRLPLARAQMVKVLPILPLVLRKVLGALRQPEETTANAVARAQTLINQTRRQVQAAGDLQSRIAVLEYGFGYAIQPGVAQFMPLVLTGFTLIAVIDRWLQSWLAEKPGTVLLLLRGLPGNVTTQMDLKLWQVAKAIRDDEVARQKFRTTSSAALAETYRQGDLPPAAQHGIRGFLEEYGMRAAAEIDLGRARWRDNPAGIMETIKGYIQVEDTPMAPDVVFQRGQVEAERLAAELVARVRRTRFGPLRAKLLAGAIRRMRVLNGMRETPKLYMITMLDIFRTALLDSGQTLAAQGALKKAEDIFFVPLPVLKQVARGEKIELQPLVAQKRAAFELERARKQIPRLILNTGETFYGGMDDAEAGTAELIGDPVSPGVAEGKVRVVLEPHSARLEPGEILVCPATDPGWTPLFLTAGGLVMEMGGLATHGSVVAREYGIPAVVGVRQATTRLETGQRVRVDGNTGKIKILDHAGKGPGVGGMTG
ncbi:MAG: phosphoenolpyruvate synthase [Chloroflexi bacterium]|nr:phosphoenolpyruvate synthase [Chloroflexota bacterium]